MDDQGRQSPDEKTWKDHWESVEEFKQAVSHPPARGVSILAHPAALLIAAAIGIAGVVYSLRDICSPKELHTAVLAGLAVGLPTIVIEKWVLRRYRGFYAEYWTTPYAERQSWRLKKTDLLCNLPVYLGILGIIALVGYLGIPESLGVSVSLSIFVVLFVLLYPEHRAIWLAAKARVAEMERSTSTTNGAARGD